MKRNNILSIFAVVLSIIAVVIGLIAICQCSWRSNLTFDYLGAIVGILAILVTVLVAWNIFTIWSFESKTKKAYKEIAELKESELANYAENIFDRYSYCISFATIHRLLSSVDAETIKRQEAAFNFLWFKIWAIHYAAYNSHFDECNDIIIETIRQFKVISVTITRERRTELQAEAARIPQQDSISEFRSLLAFLSELPIV